MGICEDKQHSKNLSLTAKVSFRLFININIDVFFTWFLYRVLTQQEEIMSSAISKLQIFNSKGRDESYLKQYMSIKHHLYSAEWKYCHEWRDPLDDQESLKFQQDLTGDLKKEISINIPK